MEKQEHQKAGICDNCNKFSEKLDGITLIEWKNPEAPFGHAWFCPKCADEFSAKEI